MGPPPSTFGNKPPSFKLNGESYYIGADVGNYLKSHRGKLYKQYPNMWKRPATIEEKKQIHEALNNPNLSSNIMLVRADEVDEIIAGNDEKYKNGGAGRHATPGATPYTPTIRKESTPHVHSSRHTRSTATPGAWFNSHIAGSQHDVVATALPPSVGRGRPKHRENLYDATDHAHLAALSVNAKISEELVPIRIDMDVDGVRIRDAFTYNKNETIITPEIFAESFCEDLDINNPQMTQQIAASIRQQIAAYDELLPIDGAVDQRAQIKLNINVQNENLIDTVEWDIAEPRNSPEEFANQLCRDLQIGGEYLPSIAYSIRGQIAFYRRTFAHSDTQLPVISGVHPLRTDNETESFAPRIEIMSDAEMDKKFRDSDRNTRRMRRLQAMPYNTYG